MDILYSVEKCSVDWEREIIWEMQIAMKKKKETTTTALMHTTYGFVNKVALLREVGDKHSFILNKRPFFNRNRGSIFE